MQITSLSPSAYNTIDDCQMKYFIGNVLRIREPEGLAAEKGTFVHEFLEILALYKMAQQDGKTTLNNGYEEVPAIDPMMVNIDDLFKYLTERFKFKNTFKPADLKDCRKWIDVALASNEDPRKLNIVSPEHKFSLEIDEPWANYIYEDSDGKPQKGKYRINGIIDLITKVDDTTYKLIDWKTGARKDWLTGQVKEYDDLYKDIQLNIYYYCLSKLYPNIKNFIITIFYLKDGGPYDLAFDPSNEVLILAKLKAQFQKIASVTVPKLSRTWKCQKFCFYSKLVLPDAPMEFRKKQLDEVGTKMCACTHLHELIKLQGINKVTKDFKKT